MSVYEYESVKSELHITRKQMVTVQSKLAILENDNQQLQTTLANMTASVSWAHRQSEITYNATIELVEEKLQEIRRRFNYIQGTIDDSLLFTNKTHFMEEVNVLKRAKADLEAKVSRLQAKLAQNSHS